MHTDGGRVDFARDDINACGFIPGKRTYSWTGGQMKADLCIVCTGATQASSLYADSGLESWLNEKGQVKVRGFCVCLSVCLFFLLSLSVCLG